MTTTSLSVSELIDTIGVKEWAETRNIKRDFRYTPATNREHSDCILQIVKEIESDDVARVTDEGRADTWETAWKDNLDRYVKSGSSYDLIPRYLYKYVTLRYKRQFIIAESKHFEADYYTMVCRILFSHLRDSSTIIEFGCGPCYALSLMAEEFPDKTLIGCDWTKTSQMILGEIVSRTGAKIAGVNFNMFYPSDAVPFTPGCGVFTALAMEQMGVGWGAFLDYLLKNKPGICVHLEPLLELYDENNLLDFLAVRYHVKRGYLAGYLPTLRRYEQMGRVKILDARRLYFGGLYHEPYSVLVWRPV